jgi:TolA-binding protein
MSAPKIFLNPTDAFDFLREVPTESEVNLVDYICALNFLEEKLKQLNSKVDELEKESQEGTRFI